MSSWLTRRTKEQSGWRCADWRWFKCPFIISTREEDEEIKVVKMTDPEGHRCSKDKTGVILHKFKLKLKERMQANLDENWSKVWSSERTKLLESVNQRELFSVQQGRERITIRLAAQLWGFHFFSSTMLPMGNNLKKRKMRKTEIL